MRQLLTVLTFVAMVTVNTLANILPINGQQTGELSDKYPTLFTPAGYVSSIWGVIYLLLGAFVVYQALPSQRNNERLRPVRGIFIVNAFANAAWIFAWHYELVEVSLGIMLVILGTLIVIYRLLNIGRSDATTTERRAVHLAFSVYLGWITVATVANVSAALIDNGFDGGELESLWAAGTIAVAALIGLAALTQRSDLAFAAVLVWAFAGIAAKQFGHDVVVFGAATFAALAIVVIGVGQLGQTTRPTPTN